MPKRSNDFQKLVMYLHKYEHTNLEIEESKYLIDNVTLEEREVDICMTTSLGSYKIYISIECIEKKRKADIGWVEMMKAKHDKLNTSKLVLVSKSGFTKQALKFASFYNIETLRFDKLSESHTDSIFRYSSLVFKIFTQSINKVHFIVRNRDGKLINVAVAMDTSVFTNINDTVFSASDVISYVIHRNDAIEYFYKNGLEEHKYFEIKWVNNGFLPIFLQEIENFTLESIEEINIVGKVEFRVRAFETETGQIGDMPFIWGRINLSEKNDLLFIGTAKENHSKISIINS